MKQNQLLLVPDQVFPLQQVMCMEVIDFKERYGIEDMYSGSFYDFQTPEEKWAFMSRMIYVNRYTDPPKPVYDDLFKLVKTKIILLLPPMLIIVSKKPDLTSNDFSILKAITDFFNAASHARRRPGTTKR